MKVWVISGACRRVGKTWLARRLCSLLPEAVYAKIGHGRPVPDRPGHYFTNVNDFFVFLDKHADRRHCVVESNALSKRGFGDVSIFIDARTGTSDLRSDADELKSNADITISRPPQSDSWPDVIASIVQEQTLADEILNLLHEQQRFVSGD